jgi:hypothetical protein
MTLASPTNCRFSIGDTWLEIDQPGGFTKAGFSGLETTFQYQLLKNDDHELAMLLGLIVDWGVGCITAIISSASRSCRTPRRFSPTAATA